MEIISWQTYFSLTLWNRTLASQLSTHWSALSIALKVWEGRRAIVRVFSCLLLLFVRSYFGFWKNFALDLRHTCCPLPRDCVCVGIRISLVTRISTSVLTLPGSLCPQILIEHLLCTEHSPAPGDAVVKPYQVPGHGKLILVVFKAYETLWFKSQKFKHFLRSLQ